ncbi:cell division protein FtsK [Fodinicola acaciae]|uniref:cell division protein FtsK n=1 Tax=Fodinicola acaciae TaxID=2681555 RepID=UPI0013CFBBB6|nr:cell division protein FtsK [Fodinicola acaciae]
MSIEPTDNNNDPAGTDWDAELAQLNASDNTETGSGTNVVPLRKASADADRFDSSYDVDLDEDDPESASQLAKADRHFTVALPDEEQREAIIPAAFRPANIRRTLTRVARRWLHIAGFHAVRLPWYGAKTVLFGGIGALRLVDRQLRWWWLAEQTPVRRAVADNAHRDPQEAAKVYARLLEEAKVTRRWRGFVIFCECVGAAVFGPLLWNMAPWWLLAGVGAVALGGLAHLGRPAHKPIISHAVIAPRFRKLNLDIVLRAYYAAGLGHPDKPGQQVQFGAQMTRDARGVGSQVVVDLPYGKGWSDVVTAKEKIASGLDVHINQVYLTRDETSSRRHTLFVADRDPLAIPAGKTDLLDLKPRNIWRPVRFGKDERDQLVTLSLLWISVLVGAQPRKGKTFAARLLALHGAADPWVKLVIVDGKNSPDWLKFRLVAHRIIFGAVPNSNDSDPIGNLLAALDEILAHIERVNEVLKTLPVDLCPEGKLTEQLARDPRFPDLRVWLIVMEEFQVYFETEDQAVNKEIAAKLSRIQAVGPSAGVIILSSSQKPSGVGAGDVQRLFNRYRDNHAVRFALRCGNRTVSEAVLGGDAYSEGFDASSLPVGDRFRGLGYMYGATDDTPTTRTFLADHGDAEKILTAARAHRERVGTLSGMAAGEDMARTTRDVLADVLLVFLADERLHWQTIAGRLAEQMPEQYADTTPDSISAQLRSLGVPSVNVNRDGQVRKGAKAVDIKTAIARRDGNGV